MGSDLLLEVKDLHTRFHIAEGTVHAVNGISFSLKPGETIAVVGESGCGKSVTMMSILRLIPIPPGEITAGEANYLVVICSISLRQRWSISGAKRSLWFSRIR